MISSKNISYSIIDGESQGLRLDKWLQKRFKYLPFSTISKLIRTGQIRVDGSRVSCNLRLKSNQKIRLPMMIIRNYIEDQNSPKQSADINSKHFDKIAQILASVVYKDEDVLIVNKPSGIAVQGGSGLDFHLGLTLKDLRFDFPHNPLFVHRLDRQTSGLLVLARHRSAALHMFAQFKERKITKTYFCICYKVPKDIAPCGIIDANLMIKNDNNNKHSYVDDAGKPAITSYELLSLNKGIGYFKMNPLTGRTHQIRAHSSYCLSSPIIGDFKYGFKRDIMMKTIDTKRLYLHAQRIEFEAPNGHKVDVSVDFPEDFLSVLSQFNLLGSIL